MAAFNNGIIGGSGNRRERRDEAPLPEFLAPCPCGNEATWWHISRQEDFNLCDGCIRLAVPEDQRQGWQRLSTTQEEDRRQQAQRRFENQDDRYERGVAQLAPDQDRELEEDIKRPKTLGW